MRGIHEAGVLHRDLKPGNVMLREDGSLALIDFGLAKDSMLALEVTDHGQIFGTPHYMSPEQGHGERIDARSDLYSLGVMLFEMLAREKPYLVGQSHGDHLQAPQGADPDAAGADARVSAAGVEAARQDAGRAVPRRGRRRRGHSGGGERTSFGRVGGVNTPIANSLSRPAIEGSSAAPIRSCWPQRHPHGSTTPPNTGANSSSTTPTAKKKAASTALALMFAYPEDRKLTAALSRLAREELRHFEQVQRMMDTLNVPYIRQKPGRYGAGMRGVMRTADPGRKLDLLLIGALIEARSAERFRLLAPRLPEPLADFYATLERSEARHFELYLGLAHDMDTSKDGVESARRLSTIAAKEAELATGPDDAFRFHSGAPTSAAS